jgi:predicted PurR-regulated permease PerM
MNPSEFPTPWQQKTMWSAVTAVAMVAIGAIGVGSIWLVSHVLGFLQPILVPFAIAGVMAYLLDPVVSKVVAWGTSRQRAVLFVFAVVTIIFAGVLIWIIPALSTQSLNLMRKVPRYTTAARTRTVQLAETLHRWYDLHTPLPQFPPKSAEPAPISPKSPADGEKAASGEKTTPVESATTGAADIPPATANEPLPADQVLDFKQFLSPDWLQSSLKQMIDRVSLLMRQSLGGFLGVIGFLLSLIIVPVYLYYFLIEAPNIEKSWSDYLPLRASAFKDEVVSVLNEINGYLIAFFRGQLIVSLINGAVTGVGLVSAGLEFGLLIGLALCVLGIVPYLGITFCWGISLVIAFVQGGSWCVPAEPMWMFPVVISGIFIIVHHIDGLFVTPKIVGDSVGLHPLTVIFSVFVWSLLMGGLLGAILAVPMTATLKVLLKRYVWERRLRSLEEALTATPAVAASPAPVAAAETPERPRSEEIPGPSPVMAASAPAHPLVAQ